MRRLLGLLVGALLVAACGGGQQQLSGSTTLTVLAAASLSGALGEIGQRFHSAHQDVQTKMSFGASSTLGAQIAQGAPADVFASADDPSMATVTKASLVDGSPHVFARNRLAVIVGRGNPKGIHGLQDLARNDLVVVLCAPQVPCGRYARQSLGKAGVTVKPKSDEADVKSVVSKVVAGEADAGIVYVTDITATAGKADAVDIPAPDNVEASYPIAVISSSPNRAAARNFVDFVTRSEGQQVLQRFGFQSP